MSVVRIFASGGHGTGIVVATRTSEAFVITAGHVLRGETLCQVQIGSEPCEATLHQEDPALDLALLKIEGSKSAPQAVTFAERLPVDWDRSASRVAYGFRDTDDVTPAPQSLEGNLISGGTRGATFQLAGSELYPGFSGGPLFLVTGGRSLCVGMTLRGNSERASAASSVFLHSSEIIRVLLAWDVEPLVETAERSKLRLLVRILAPLVLAGTAGYIYYSDHQARAEANRGCQELVGKVNFHLRDYVMNSASERIRDLGRKFPARGEDPEEKILKGAVDGFCLPFTGGN